MTQETVSGIAPTSEVESLTPSKRLNRKKGRRGPSVDEDGSDDDRQAAPISPLVDGSSGDRTLLPSPIAAVNDAFETLDVEQAMGNLALIPTVDKKMVNTEPTGKKDGLLMLPIHPSSGRVPRTPPSTPELFLTHSPEKEQSKVVPMSLDIYQLPSTSVETIEEEQDRKAEHEATLCDETVPLAFVELHTVESDKEGKQVLDHETSLSDTLAGMSLTNGDLLDSEFVEISMPIGATLNSGVADMRSPFDADNVNASVSDSIVCLQSATTVEHTQPVHNTARLPSTTPEKNKSVVDENFFPLKPICDMALKPYQIIPGELSKTVESNLPFNDDTMVQESSQFPRCLPDPKTHSSLSTTSKSSTTTSPNKAVLLFKSGQMTTTGVANEPKPRPVKRKGDAPDVKPPPAPALAATSESRPKRSTPRRFLGSVNESKVASDAKLDLAVAARPVSELNKDFRLHPTANSIARATAAEARKALLNSAAAKRSTIRKLTSTKPWTRSAVQAPNPSSYSRNKTILAPPAPVADYESNDNQRNIKRRLNAADAEAASNRLYANAVEAKARKEAYREELQETYTFAPQVNKYKRRMQSEESEEPNDDHFSRLHAQAKKLAEKKRDLQQQYERDGCTFVPSISRRAKRLTQPSKGSRYEILYKDAEELKQKREAKLLEQAKTTEELCPFKPKITSSRAPTKTKPLYDSEREKLKRLAREQQKIDSEMSKCTFKPQVSTKRFKAKADSPSGTTAMAAAAANPFNRLYQGSIDRTERLKKLRQEQDEIEKAQAPFQPTISARSRMLQANANAKEPFYNRLYNKDYMKQVDAEREQRRLEEEHQFTFKPEIIEPPQEIKAKVNDRASPEKSIFERLYDEKDKVKEKIELGEELRLQKEMAECTFRPQIEVDAVLSNSEPAAPVWERLLSYDKAQVIEEREKLKEQLEMQECTFRPEVKSPDTLVSPPPSTFNRLTGSSSSPVDPTRPSFITTRSSSSLGRQSLDVSF